MGYSLIYQLAFTNVEGKNVYIDICDKESFTDAFVDQTIISLQGAGDPLHIVTTDNDEDKFTPIRGKQAIIKFLSTANTSLKTFSEGEDDRWFVNIWLDGQVDSIFQGYLILDDNEQQFLDDETACEVTLTATDNLGLLKDIPLTNYEGVNPKGKFKIAEFIFWALSKTSLNLQLMVANNLMEQDSQQLPFYHTTYLDAKTFETEVGESEDCYTVLEKILGQDSFLTQSGGRWWIVRVDELQTGELFTHHFDLDGSYINSQPSTIYLQDIGGDKPLWLAEEATAVHLERPSKETKTDFTYANPIELIDNIDFNRGELWPVYTTTDYNAYYPVDWTLKAGNYDSPQAPTSSAFIRRKFLDNGQYETERVMVLTAPTDGWINWLQSNPVPIGYKDKISVSIDFYLSANLTGNSGDKDSQSISLFLQGDDGKTYAYGGGVNFSPDWYEYPNGTQPALYLSWDKTTVNEAFETQTISAEVKPAPVSGKLTVLLNSHSNCDVYYNNLQFRYTPYIYGTYAKFKGHRHTVEQDGNYKAKYEGETYLGDAPRKYMKGAMFKLVNGQYELTQNWYNGSIFPGGLPQATGQQQKNLILVHHRNNVNNDADYSYVGWYVYLSEVAPAGYYLINGYETAWHDTSAYPPDPPLPPSIIPLSMLVYKGASEAEVILNTRFSNHKFTNQQSFDVTANIIAVTGLPAVSEYAHPYNELQAWSVWNQKRRTGRLMDASIGGLQTDLLNVPDCIHHYRFTDPSLHTYEKFFVLLHFDMDFYLCQWSGTFAEVYDKRLGKSYAEKRTFRYITDNN